MSGLKISELTQPSLSSDKNIRLTDLLPIARASLTGEDTFALPGVAFTTNLNSIGNGGSLIRPKTFDPNVGNLYSVKTLSANAPIVISDDNSTITLNLSGTISNAIAGLTPIKAKFVGTGAQTFFPLPNVALPTDPSAYRVDTNGVVQEPGVDYTIITDTTPFQIRFVTAPILNEKVVVVAFAPSVKGTDTSMAPIKITRTGTGSVSAFDLPLVSLPTDPAAYRVDIGGSVKEPGVDYFITTTTDPYKINFVSTPLSGQKIVIVAFAPAVNSTAYASPIVQANSVFANRTNFDAAGTSLAVNQPNTFVGNIGDGLTSVNLSRWNQRTTSYTILTSDFSGTIAMSSSSPTTVTIPNNNFSAGFQVTVIQLGTGTVTFSPSAGSPGTPSATGVILNQAYALTRLSSRWSAATIIYSGNPSTGWTIFGDLA